MNGNIILVGVPTVISYDGMRFGAWACVFEPCKGYVLACFGACQPTNIRFRLQVNDVTYHTIGFIFLIYPYNGYIRNINPIV